MRAIRAIADLLDSAATLVLILLALFFLSRLVSWMWYRVRQHGQVPLVISVTNSAETDNLDKMLSARLLAYIGEAGAGLHVIVPGGGEVAGPEVAEEAPDSSAGWTALFRLALATRPAYKLEFTCETGWSCREAEQAARAFCRGAGQIARAPGNRVFASGVFEESDEDALIEAIGCFAVQNLCQQRSIRRRTPRWERWSAQESGYRAYRKALEFERRNDTDSALRYYEKAIREEPANFVIAVHYAALLELSGKYRDAADAYRTANELWPEHIETAYRLQATCYNCREYEDEHEEGLARLAEAENVLDAIRWSLTLSALLQQWLRTWVPSRWNPGERKYWGSWLWSDLYRSDHKRRNYLKAIVVSRLTIGLARTVKDHSLPDSVRRASVRGALADLASLITKPSGASAEVRLFHPERFGDESAVRHRSDWNHSGIEGVDRVFEEAKNGNHRSAKRDAIGWLAHYNAACFFSVALQIQDQGLLPPGFTIEDWRNDCTRAAVRELGYAVRDPRNLLEPEWYRSDPDLQPLRQRLIGSRWARFAGTDHLNR